MFRSVTPVVKKLIFINVGVWCLFVLIVQNFFTPHPSVFQIFGLVPVDSVFHFRFWQFFTYMFIHSNQIFHLLFNMLILWWLGGDLEETWGKRFFLLYYFVCGVGAAVFYTFFLFVYYFIAGKSFALTVPVVGASGAVFGLILAYGILFGERIIYFMMLFPMKAKHFVLILAGIELVTLLNTGVKSDVANLAHLGGIVVGFLFLRGFVIWKRKNRSTKWGFKGVFRPFLRKKRHLKLILDRESDKKSKEGGKKYWH